MSELQKLAKNLISNPIRGLAAGLIVVGAAFFAAGTMLAASIFTLLSILAVIAGAVLAVVAFIKGNVK